MSEQNVQRETRRVQSEVPPAVIVTEGEGPFSAWAAVVGALAAIAAIVAGFFIAGAL